MFKAGVDVQVFSIWCDGTQTNPYTFANREIDTLYAWIKRNPGKMVLVKNSNELMQAVKQHKLASMIGVEGGHMMEDDLNKLDSLYARGTRYMTLTWNNNTSWATSAKYETDSSQSSTKGLTTFGKQVVQRVGVGAADIHAGAAANRLEPFQHLDIGSRIGCSMGDAGGIGGGRRFRRGGSRRALRGRVLAIRAEKVFDRRHEISVRGANRAPHKL